MEPGAKPYFKWSERMLATTFCSMCALRVDLVFNEDNMVYKIIS